MPQNLTEKDDKNKQLLSTSLVENPLYLCIPYFCREKENPFLKKEVSVTKKSKSLNYSKS